MADAYDVAQIIHGLVGQLAAGPGPWPLMAEPGLQSTIGACAFAVRVPGSPPEKFSVLVTPLGEGPAVWPPDEARALARPGGGQDGAGDGRYPAGEYEVEMDPPPRKQPGMTTELLED